MEDVMILSMDLSMKCSVGTSVVRLPNLVDLELYTGRTAYNIAEDADLLEWSVSDHQRA